MKQDHPYNLVKFGQIEMPFDFGMIEDEGLLKFEENGWVQGRSVKNPKNISNWINDEEKYSHLHISNGGLFNHHHGHKVVHKDPERMRKFQVRCFQDI